MSEDGPVMKALKVIYAPQISAYEGIASLLKRSPEEKELQAFKVQIQRDEAKAALAKSMAAVQQEIAIASRISTADEVEIEEYYEAAGKGSAGATIDEKGAMLGVSGEGRRITKRVLRFKGWRDGLDLPSAITQFSEGKEPKS